MYTSKDKEWQRLLNNPDNVIVSDSLLDKLSPQDLAIESQHAKMVDISASVHFENCTVEGKLVNYINKNSLIVLSLTGHLENFVQVLHNMDIQQVNVRDSISDNHLQIIMLPEDDNPEWELNCEDEYNATLTVTIKKTPNN